MALRYLYSFFSTEKEEPVKKEIFYDFSREKDLKKLYNIILNRNCTDEELDYYMKNKYSLKRIEKSLINSDEGRKVKDKIFGMDNWIKFCEDHTYFLRTMEFINPPKFSENNLVFVDFRFLNNFEFVIRNALLKLEGNFMVTFVCNDNNYDKIKILCDMLSSNIEIIKLEGYKNCQLEYNNYLLDVDFWKKLKGKNILIHQFDAIIFKKNFYDFVDYDYIGSLINTDNGIIMNGGFSMRKKEKMINLLEYFKPSNIFEDKFFSSKVIIDDAIAKRFGTQDFYSDAFGGHKFWISKLYESKELYEKLFKPDMFSKYPILFHKYSLNLADPNKEITYLKKNEVKSDKRLVCHIHCYDISKFQDFFGEYYENIKKHFFVIVTYSKGIASIEDFKDIVLLNIENRGADIGGKFCATHYLKNINYSYDFILMIHSKSDKNKRETYLRPFVKDIEKIISLLNRDTGIYCPELIWKGNIEIFYQDRELKKIEDLKHSKTWGRNKDYMEDIIKYFNIPYYNYLFPEGNFYIISKSLADVIYSDKKIYNCLNDSNSFDYSWVKNYYKVEDNKDIFDVYVKYKKDNLIGNNFMLGKGWEGLADSMLEHVFERIIFGICKKLDKKVHILGNKNNEMFNNFITSGDLKDLNIKPVTIIACHTSSEIKLKALRNNIKYLKDISSDIYIINSKEFSGKLENYFSQYSDKFVINNELNDFQAECYKNTYYDLKKNIPTIEDAKNHWRKFGINENRKLPKDFTNITIEYVENDKYVCHGKWKYILDKIKNKYKSYILTNDSFFLTREINDFIDITSDNEMVSILDSNQRRYHYPDFLRWYSVSGVNKLINFYEERFKDCHNFYDMIDILEMESTNLFQKKKCLYEMSPLYEGNIHFDDKKNEHYLNNLNYPIIKIKKLLSNFYRNFPVDFEPIIYRDLHPDLKQLTVDEANLHFSVHGYSEGRIYKKNQKTELPKYLEDYLEAKKINIC